MIKAVLALVLAKGGSLLPWQVALISHTPGPESCRTSQPAQIRRGSSSCALALHMNSVITHLFSPRFPTQWSSHSGTPFSNTATMGILQYFGVSFGIGFTLLTIFLIRWKISKRVPPGTKPMPGPWGTLDSLKLGILLTNSTRYSLDWPSARHRRHGSLEKDERVQR